MPIADTAMDMSTDRIAEAARLLAQARLNGSAIDLPVALRPASLAQAYAVQDAIAQALPWPVAGWKIGFTDPAQHARWGLSEPGYGRVFSPFFHRSPVVMRCVARPHLVESEYAFHMRSPLPARDAPYTADEVLEAVDAMHLAIEVVESRYAKPASMSAHAIIADNLHAGELVCGAAIDGWRRVDLAKVPVRLFARGELLAQGSGAQVMGHPVSALVWLANALARSDHPLAAGQIVSTGTCTGVRRVAAEVSVRAVFEDLGEVELEYEARSDQAHA